MVHTPTSTFADRIAVCIGRTGGKPSYLAAKAGLTPPAIGKYQKGSEPGLEALIKIASAAGVSLDWLATGNEKFAPTAKALASGEPNAALHDYVSIPELLVLPTDPDPKAPRAINFGAICANVRRDIAGLLFPGSDLMSLAMCRVYDSSLGPEVRNGDVIVIDTSKRDLFAGVGAFRIGKFIGIRAMHLIDVSSGQLPKYELRFRMSANQTKPLIVTDEDLGDHIDLLGAVVFAGRLSNGALGSQQ